MSSTPIAQNGTSSVHHVNNARTKHRSPSPTASTPHDSRSVSQSVNGHLQNNSLRHSSKDSQKAMSPNKLMIGVPPASTPASANILNGKNSPAATHTDVSQPLHSNGSLSSIGGRRETHLVKDIPLSQLEQELPLEDADLVPLAALVERLSNYGYEALQNLAETLSSLPSSSKRVKIFTTALDVRKQFIKLLVLARWSTNVVDLQKARNIISLLSEQQWQHEDVFAGLTDVRKILPNARMRDADLPTAIDVLRTGTYRRLPTSIKDMAVAQTPLSDVAVLAVVSRLEDALRTRMLCHEVVPASLSNYTIHDGKVHCKVHGLFECQLTASGDGSISSANEISSFASIEAHRWWLLDLRFDVATSGCGAETASKLFPAKPKQAYRERLRVWGDQELAPRDPLNQISSTGDPLPQQDPSAKASLAEDAVDEALDDVQMQDLHDNEDGDRLIEKAVSHTLVPANRDAPLVRLFAFLQERSLHYQLDILQHQAYELCRLDWGDNLRIETKERPRSLILHYWTRAQSSTSSSSASELQSGDGPAAGGNIEIHLADLDRHHGYNSSLTSLVDDEPSQHDTKGSNLQSQALLVKRRGLRVTWNADPAILLNAGTLDMTISSKDLNIERVLAGVVKQHSSGLLRHLQKQMLMGEHQLAGLMRAEDCTLCSEASLRKSDDSSSEVGPASSEYLKIDLQGRSRRRLGQEWQNMPPLSLRIDHISGRLMLEAEDLDSSVPPETSNTASSHFGLFTASALTARPNLAPLAEATERLKSSITSIYDVLRRLEIFARVGDWERKVSQIGLRSVRKLNFRVQELAKFGPSVALNGPPVLFIPLANAFPGYFLALQPSELSNIGIALICVAQVADASGTSFLTLQSVEWLDRVKIASASTKTSDAQTTFGGRNYLGKRDHNSTTDVHDSVTNALSVKPAEAGQQRGRGELTLEELSSVHSYSMALVSYFNVEQQLRMRAISYLHVNTSEHPLPPAGKPRKRQRVEVGDDENKGSLSTIQSKIPISRDTITGVQSLVPTLCLRASDLVGATKRHLCKPSVALRVRDWEDPNKMCVEISIKLRMKSRHFRALKSVLARYSTADKQPGEPQTWIGFDADTSVLIFSTKHLDSCIATFQMHWDKIARMAEMTREVLNVSRAWQQRAMLLKVKTKRPEQTIELKRFTFQDVVFAYGHALTDQETPVQLLARVRWQEPSFEMSAFGGMPNPISAGFIVEFGSIPMSLAASSTSFYASSVGTDGVETVDAAAEWFVGSRALPNPHNAMAFELRRTINAASQRQGRLIWTGFLRLLTNTLPLIGELEPLLEKSLLDADTPELEIRSATWFRLRFVDRYALDLRLTSHSRLLVCDASQPLFRSPVKGLAPASNGSNEDVFTGSHIFNTLMSGKQDTQDAATGMTYSASWMSEQSTHQFQPIPNFERILRETAALGPIGAPLSDNTAAPTKPVAQPGRKVWDLRRALLISLAPEDEFAPRAPTDDILHNILPSLISKIQSEI